MISIEDMSRLAKETDLRFPCKDGSPTPGGRVETGKPMSEAPGVHGNHLVLSTGRVVPWQLTKVN